MTTIGYMLNTYEEYGPDNIAVFGPDADMALQLVNYFAEIESVRPASEEEFSNLREWLADEKRVKNQTRDLSGGWGGVQITELAV